MTEEAKDKKPAELINELKDDDLQQVVGGVDAVPPKFIVQKGTAPTGTGLGAGKAEFDD